MYLLLSALALCSRFANANDLPSSSDRMNKDLEGFETAPGFIRKLRSDARVNLEDVIESRRSARILSDLDSDDIRRALLAEGAVSGIDNDAPVSAFATADGPSEAPAEAPASVPDVPSGVGADDYVLAFDLLWASLPFARFSSPTFDASYDLLHKTQFGLLGRTQTNNENFQNPFPTDIDVFPRLTVTAGGPLAARRKAIETVRTVRQLSGVELMIEAVQSSSIVHMSMIFRASEYGGKATGSYSAALKVFTLLSKVATNSTILDLIYSNPAALVGARSVVSARSGGVLIGGQTYPLPTVAGLSLVSGSGSTGPPQEPPKKKSSSSNTGAIVGGVVGGVGGAAVLGGVTYYVIKKRKQEPKGQNNIVEQPEAAPEVAPVAGPVL